MEQKRKYFTVNYGCQMNEYDTEVLSGHLENLGYVPAGRIEEAEVLVINTCAVRQKAEEKVFSYLGKLHSLKQQNPNMLMVLWGCMVQQESVARKVRQRYSFIDLICGPHALGRFPELLEKARCSTRPVIELSELGGRENLPVKRKQGIHAWVPISHGCDNYCSYCIVPYVRGAEKSRRPENIMQEIRELVREGYREVTLLGQNVNSYGKDLEKDMNFARLLELADGVEGLLRIRFMTSHPRDFSEEVIRVIRRGEKICEHFHLPLQAGSNNVLQRMNRGYTREDYLQLIAKIRELIPGASITTDIIAGFPGEAEADFAQTMDMVRRIRFDAAFTFVYSPRKGTRAACMEDQLAPEVKKERIVALNNLQNRISLEKNEKLVGSTREVLVEGRSKTDPEMYTGRTRTNKIVHFCSNEELTGKLVKITITKARPWTLTGQLLGIEEKLHR